MKRRLALEARLSKLEKRQLRQPLRRLILFDVAEREASEIVAYSSFNGVTVLRLAGEPLEAFRARAFATTGVQFLGARYAAHGAAERDGEAEWHSAPSQA
jgi:hypothetical protein